MGKKIIIKNNLFGFILGALIFGTVGVSAATTWLSQNVTYDNSGSGLSAVNVQDAIDEVYENVSGNNLPEHNSLAEYSAAELAVVADELALNGTESTKYAEFKGYIDSDQHWMTTLTDGTILEARIIGINHDTKTNTGKAGLTMQATHSLAKAYSGYGPWVSSSLRTSMQSGEIWELLPTDLQENIVAVDKPTAASGSSSASIVNNSETLWLMSYAEIYGGLLSGYSWTANEGTKYYFWKTVASNVGVGRGDLRLTQTGGYPSGYGSDQWYTRSPQADYSTLGRFKGADGDWGYSYSIYDTSPRLGIVLCWCF